MRRVTILFSAALLAALSCCHRADRPNVIIVCIDALRRDYLGVYGHAGAVSPTIDALAGEAVVFDHAVSVASWTKPSVTSLLTGLYPSQHRVLYKWNPKGKQHVDVLAPEIDTLAELLKRAGYRTGAFVENEHLVKRYSRLDQGFDTYVEDAGTAPVLMDSFLSWLGESPRTPFFAYLHILDPHWPYTPDDTVASQSLSADDRLRATHWGFGGSRWRLLRDGVNEGRLGLDPAELASLEALYAAKISGTDAVLGRMLQRLREKGLLDRTFLVITADHGEGFLEHGKLDHGYGMYDEILRVPLIIRFPRAEFGGRRIQAQVQSVDLAPTILDYVALPPRRPAGGRSLLAVVRGSDTEPDRPALSEEGYGHTLVTALRTGSYKYIRITRGGHGRPPVRREVPADLQPGVRVQAEGIFLGSKVVAAQVKRIASGDVDQKIVGPIAAVDASANRLRVIGYRVQADHRTHFRDGTDSITLADLRPKDWVRAQGVMQGGTLRATRIQRMHETWAQKMELEGVIEAVGAGDKVDLWLQLCGSRVLITGDAVWKDFGEERRVLRDNAQQGPPTVVPVSEELYDLAADPRELKNIAADQPQLLAQLRNMLADLRGRLAPAVKKTPSSVELDAATRERLRALGYQK